jgi:hypothetical protein
MTGIPDYMSNPNYNPNHSDWYPGKHSQTFRANWDRIFGKKEINNGLRKTQTTTEVTSNGNN